MTVVRGKVFDVVVDIRKNSKTFGKYKGFILSDEGPQQILIHMVLLMDFVFYQNIQI